MANCPHCNKPTNGPPLSRKCDSCGSTWCQNGNCPGTYNKRNSGYPSDNHTTKCPYCQKGKVKKI